MHACISRWFSSERTERSVKHWTNLLTSVYGFLCSVAACVDIGTFGRSDFGLVPGIIPTFEK